jgi:hypothetical protein
MATKRKNIYFTEQQVTRLEQKSRQEHLSEAEIVRRALDAYLAWDDPTYRPSAASPISHRRSHPRMNDRRFPTPVL